MFHSFSSAPHLSFCIYHNSWRTNQSTDSSLSPCITLLGDALRALQSNETDTEGENAESSLWPAGFSSLQNLSIGVESRAVRPKTEEDGTHDFYEFDVKTLAPLLLFPHLEYLYVSDLDFDDDGPDGDDEDEDDDPDHNVLGLPPGCSNIKTLFLDSTSPSRELLEPLLRAAANLEQFAFQRCDLHQFDFEELGQWVNPKLDRLVTYDCQVQGYRSAMYHLEDMSVPCKTVHLSDFLSVFGDEKQIEKKLNDLQDFFGPIPFDRDTLYTDRFNPAELLGQIGGMFLWKQTDVIIWIGNARAFQWFFAREKLFPNKPTNEECWEILDEAFANIISDGKMSECKAFNLMCIEQGSNDKIAFQRTIKAGQEKGVPVYTRTTKLPRNFGSLLPVGATEDDLKDNPREDQSQTQEIYLHPFRGMVRGCRNCGNCQSCFNVYPKQLWESRTWE